MRHGAFALGHFSSFGRMATLEWLARSFWGKTLFQSTKSDDDVEAILDETPTAAGPRLVQIAAVVKAYDVRR